MNYQIFYARFDKQNTSTPPSVDKSTPPPIIIDEHDVKAVLRKQNVRKAPGPDGILTSTLRHCADQLTPVFTDIFNTSVTLQIVPYCFKLSTIIPVPKKTNPKSSNDFRPVALTSVVMKVFERIMLKYIQSLSSSLLDPYQFAYRANRSVENAVSITLHNVLNHLDSPNSYVRMLFIDYSSAFNTILPCKLYFKLKDMFCFNSGLCNWILDFLLNRPQKVKFNNTESDIIILNTGAPQGCVLSPLLYSLFTNDCKSMNNTIKIVKFADDTIISGLISNNDESVYRQEIERLVNWCDNNNLTLNPSKTKEMIIDFRQNKPPINPVLIDNVQIEVVNKFKFLGTIISNDLKWQENVTATVKKANKRLYFLRLLNTFNVNLNIMQRFYSSIIESILTFSIIVHYSSLTTHQRNSLSSVVLKAQKVIGSELPYLSSIYMSRLQKRAKRMIKDPTHPAHSLLELLPSGRRYRRPANRYDLGRINTP